MKEFFNSNKPWIIQGLFWGIFMFTFMIILLPLGNDEPITSETILKGIGIWTIGGLVFGYMLKLISSKKEKGSSQKEHLEKGR